MAVTEEALELAKSRAQRDSERAQRAIAAIQRKYDITLTELSVALGVYAPEVGKAGRSQVSAWKTGARSPDHLHLAVLEMLVSGELDLVRVGKEGRRSLYNVIPAMAEAA